MSLYNFWLFHLRRHVKNLVFVLHHRFQTRPTARVFICIVSWCLEPLIKHFLGILLTSLWSGILFLCQTISFVFWGRWFFSHFRSTGTFIVVCIYFEGIYKVMLIFQNRVFHMPIRKLQHVRLNCNKQKEYGEIDKVCLFWFIDCPK